MYVCIGIVCLNGKLMFPILSRLPIIGHLSQPKKGTLYTYIHEEREPRSCPIPKTPLVAPCGHDTLQ